MACGAPDLTALRAAGVDAVGVVFGVVTEVPGTLVVGLLVSPGFMMKIRSTGTRTTREQA